MPRRGKQQRGRSEKRERKMFIVEGTGALEEKRNWQICTFMMG